MREYNYIDLSFASDRFATCKPWSIASESHGKDTDIRALSTIFHLLKMHAAVLTKMIITDITCTYHRVSLLSFDCLL